MEAAERRYDIDWVRVIAIGLLLLYHVAIGFQPWAIMIGFISNENSWTNLWVPMTMLNVWRIPLLFFVSGMGVYFAVRRRNWKQLLKERTGRILIPFLFGMIFIAPISLFLLQYYYHWDFNYIFHPGHLWFLGNIFIYVLVLSPIFFFLKYNEERNSVVQLKKIFSSPFGLMIVILAFVLEAIWLKPFPYELYAMSWHGFFLGLLAFFFGFCFVLSGNDFWKMILNWRWLLLAVAASFYVYRLMQFQMQVPVYLLSIESNFWIFSVFAFAFKYLNRPSKALVYLSEAAYPIYILHMIFLSLGSVLIFPMEIDNRLQFFMLLLFTGLGSFITFELLIKRFNILRLLFGLKRKKVLIDISLEIHAP